MGKRKQLIEREGKAIFLAIATFAGVYTFLTILKESWPTMPTDPIQLALATALLTLPKVFARLHRSRDPYTVQFARAFREGFLALSSIAPNVSKIVTKAKGLFRNIIRE